jgi:hypothetical protein
MPDRIGSPCRASQETARAQAGTAKPSKEAAGQGATVT